MGPNVKIISLILNAEGTGKLVCIPLMLAGANLETGVTFLMRKIPNHAIGDLSLVEEVAPRTAKANSLQF